MKKRPLSTLAWIWSVLLFPFVGPVAFLIFGVDRITPDRSGRRSGFVLPEIDRIMHGTGLDLRTAGLIRSLSSLGRIPPSCAGDPVLLPDAETFYPALVRSIGEARHHVHVEFFTWQADRVGRGVLEALVAAAGRGVQVRVLLDRIGCTKTARGFFNPLVEAGGQFAWFRSINPLRKHFSFHLRNHRKLQIIDAQTAYVGGMNIGKEYEEGLPAIGPWRDLQMKMAGAVVGSLQRLFAEDWLFASREEFHGKEYFPERSGGPGSAPAQVVLGGPDLGCDAMADSMAAIVHYATSRAWIAAGYFCPNEILLNALRVAAARGVDVRLLISARSDHPFLAYVGRSYFEQLLEGGVRILEYLPGIHHAKAMLIDESIAMIGSANCDNRSMRLNFELNVLCHSAALAQSLERFFVADFGKSRELRGGEFRQRPLWERAFEVSIRPLAPMI